MELSSALPRLDQGSDQHFWPSASRSESQAGLASPAQLSCQTWDNPTADLSHMTHQEAAWFDKKMTSDASPAHSPQLEKGLLSPFCLAPPQHFDSPPLTITTQNTKLQGLFGSSTLPETKSTHSSPHSPSTPNCPPPVTLGAESVPRFPTPSATVTRYTPIDEHAYSERVPFPTQSSSSTSPSTPICPPPVSLGSESVPRFATPDSLALGLTPTTAKVKDDVRSPDVMAAGAGTLEQEHDGAPVTPEPVVERGRLKDARKSLFGMRLPSRSASTKDGRERSKDGSRREDRTQPRAEIGSGRGRRLSLSEKLSNAFRIGLKKKEVVPPLPSTTSAASLQFKHAKSPNAGVEQPMTFVDKVSKRISRSISSPNLRGKAYQDQLRQIRDVPLPTKADKNGSLLSPSPLDTEHVSKVASPAPTDTERSKLMRNMTLQHISVPMSPCSSLPSLSPASTHSVFDTSLNCSVNTPTSSPNVKSNHWAPSSLPTDVDGPESIEEVASPLTMDNLRVFRQGDEPVGLFGDHDVLRDRRLSHLKLSSCSGPVSREKSPFAFVPSEMSKKPLKMHRSSPDMRSAFRPPRRASSPPISYYGHSLLPQTDEHVFRRSSCRQQTSSSEGPFTDFLTSVLSFAD